MKRIKTLFIILILLLISCSEMDSETPSVLFGLPHVAIEMRESDFAQMRHGALVNEYAAITITSGGVKKHGKIRRRGRITRQFPKSSFNVDTEDGLRHYVAANIDKSYCRDILSNMVFEKHGFLTSEMEFVSLSVNGIYQGLYISREPIDEAFFRRRNIDINSLYISNLNGLFTHKNGSNTAAVFEKVIPKSSIHFDDLNMLISVLDENHHAKIEQFVHISNIANYSFICSAINHADGIRNNLYISNSKKDNKFYIIPYDMDGTFWGDPANPTKFENGLLEKAEEIFLRNQDLTRDHYVKNVLNVLSLDIVDSLRALISQAYKNDPYHQGENLDEHIAGIKGYISTARH